MNPNYLFQQELLEAIRKNNIKLLQRTIIDKASDEEKKKIKEAIFLQEYPKSNDTQNIPKENLTLLHICAFYDALECFQLLNEEFGFDLRINSADSYLPLHYACLNGSFEVANYILEKDPEQAKLAPGGLAHHFLYLAVVGGGPEILEDLFRCGADLNQSANKKDDPISKAIACSNIECLKVLLRHGNRTNTDGMTNAMKAAFEHREDAVMLLVEGIEDIKKVSNDGNTLIGLCCSHGLKFKNVILNLLKIVGDEPIEPPQTPSIEVGGVCQWICQMADLDVAKALLSTKGYNINRLDNNGYPGPYTLFDKKIPNQDFIALLEMLIQHGFDVNVRRKPDRDNKYSTRSLLEMCTNSIIKRPEVIKFLISKGADINAPSLPTGEPLAQIVLKGRKDIAKIFQDKIDGK